MTKTLSVGDYLAECPSDKKEALQNLRKTILDKLPEGFKETISYGMIAYVVPHSVYPAGYHCDTSQPLPFISIAARKSHISFSHMGIYADEELANWFVENYKKIVGKKPAMGKSCIRFKKRDQIPFELMTELIQKMSVKDWIEIYESKIKR
ncbi:MAG: DUF1801 domain-containing protein [Bacteroidota bacterium]